MVLTVFLSHKATLSEDPTEVLKNVALKVRITDTKKLKHYVSQYRNAKAKKTNSITRISNQTGCLIVTCMTDKSFLSYCVYSRMHNKIIKITFMFLMLTTENTI